MGRRDRLQILPLAALLAGLGLAEPAAAWKPKTHIYLAEIARRDAVDDGKVTIYEVDHETGKIAGELGKFEVNPNVLVALRESPAQFRAGVVGPDAYPDMVTGQQLIHPGTNLNHPGDSRFAEAPSAPGTDAWLTHLWRTAYGRLSMADLAIPITGGGVAGGSYATKAGGTFQTPQVRAFVVGYVTHAAGDMFMHTFVNHYAGGDFALKPDPRNAIKHIVLEGYVGTRTQPLGQGMGISINGVDDFIHIFMVAGRPGTILYDRLMQGAGAETSLPAIFSALRADLQRDVDDYERARLARKGPERLAYAGANGPMAEFKKAWIKDIDRGLRAWPVTSHLIAREIIYNEQDAMNLSEAKYHATQYMLDYGLSMLGAPDVIVVPLNVILDVIEALPSPFKYVLAEIKKELFEWMVKSATGLTPDELSSYLKDPARHFDAVMNSPGGGHGGRTDHRITLAQFNREVLGIDDPSTKHPDQHFHPYGFAPAFNTIQMTKIAFLSEKGMTDLRAALKAKGADAPAQTGKYENPMLGFLRSMDADNQWQQAPGRNAPPFARGNAAAWRLLFKRQIGQTPGWPTNQRTNEKPDSGQTPAPAQPVDPAQLAALKAIEGDYVTNTGTLLTVTVDGVQVKGRAVTRTLGKLEREQLALTLTAGGELEGTWKEEDRYTTWRKVRLRFAPDNMSFKGSVETNPAEPPFDYLGERLKTDSKPADGAFRETGYFALRIDAAGRPKGPGSPIEVAITVRNAQGGRRGVQYNDDTFTLIGSDGREYRSDGNFYGKSGEERLNATVWLMQDEQTAVTYLFPGVPAGVSPSKLVVQNREKQLGEFALDKLPATRPAASTTQAGPGAPTGQPLALEGFTVLLVAMTRGADGAWEAVVTIRNTGDKPLPFTLDLFRMTLLDADGDTRQATGDIYEPDGPVRRSISRYPTLSPGGEFRLKLMFPETATMTPNRYQVQDANGKSAVGGAPTAAPPTGG